jgi:hypothetical protein
MFCGYQNTYLSRSVTGVVEIDIKIVPQQAQTPLTDPTPHRINSARCAEPQGIFLAWYKLGISEIENVSKDPVTQERHRQATSDVEGSL